MWTLFLLLMHVLTPPLSVVPPLAIWLLSTTVGVVYFYTFRPQAHDRGPHWDIWDGRALSFLLYYINCFIDFATHLLDLDLDLVSGTAKPSTKHEMAIVTGATETTHREPVRQGFRLEAGPVRRQWGVSLATAVAPMGRGSLLAMLQSSKCTGAESLLSRSRLNDAKGKGKCINELLLPA